MKLASFEIIVHALNEAGVRYLVVGGLAVNAHGYLRLTADVDLVLSLKEANVLKALEALATIGYKPSIPVQAGQFADKETRHRWIKEKSMIVLNLFSDEHPETSVDIFAEEPFDFALEYADSLQAELAPGLTTRFATLSGLIAMKEKAGRPRDHDDIQHLRWIQQEREKND